MYYNTGYDESLPAGGYGGTTTPSGGSGGGTGGLSGGSDFNWSDFASSSENQSQSQSFTGPSDWSKQWSQNFLGKMEPWLQGYAMDQAAGFNKSAGTTSEATVKQLNDLLANLGATRSGLSTDTAGMRELIEKSRSLMPQQYMNEMALYNQRATQPVLNNMSNRGILNSSVTGGALSDVLRDTQAKQSDLVTQSDLWAANKNYDLSQWLANQGLDINKLQLNKQYELNDTSANRALEQQKEQRAGLLTSEMNYANMIPSLLNALRESTSQSQSSGSSYGGLMELLQMAYGGGGGT